jgi:Glycosyltransferase family 87
MTKEINTTKSGVLSNSKSIFTPLIYIFSVLLAVVLPVVIWQLNVPIIARTNEGNLPGTIDSQPFELFGLFISVLLAIAAWLNIKKQKRRNLITIAPIILALLVSLEILFVIIEELHPKGPDYLCYEHAAQAVLSHLNPYTVYFKCYLYPPLLAQILAFLERIVNWKLLLVPGDEQKVWTIVFYFFQCCQFLQILLAYYLTYQLAQKIGLRTIPTSVIVSALFLFNNPIFRTIKFSQINVWILNCFLLSILLLPRHPFFGGFALAIGAHIKLYTLALMLPLAIAKRWLAMIGGAVGFVAILFLQTGFGKDWTLWQQFIGYFAERVEKPSNYRNSSIWSFLYNLVKIPSRFIDASFFDFVPYAVLAINLIIVIWFIVRIFKREQAFLGLPNDDYSDVRKYWNTKYRLYGHSIDSIALGLMISPSVWEHHYTIAIPIALWAIVTRRRDRPWLTSLGVFLIFCLPTFDVFPLSHHRMLGLFILVYLTNPLSVQKYFLRLPKSYSLTPHLGKLP